MKKDWVLVEYSGGYIHGVYGPYTGKEAIALQVKAKKKYINRDDPVSYIAEQLERVPKDTFKII
jgi:hypothetical protein